MTDVRIRVEHLGRLQIALQVLSGGLRNMPVMAQVAEQGAAVARALAPRRTGALAASVRSFRAGNKAVVVAGGRGVDYARAQNLRTRYMRAADLAMQAIAPSALQTAIDRKIREANLS